jgi:uncharacterized protein with PIN domain
MSSLSLQSDPSAARPAAAFVFDEMLRWFLPRRQQAQQPLLVPCDRRASVKDMIEALGVPHAEVTCIRVNQAAVQFDYLVRAGDVIEVSSSGVPPNDCAALRPPLTGSPRFVLDTHLGRLAAYLRMMGFDTLYRNDFPDDELAAISHRETRILLTRDVGLLKRSLVIYGYYVRATQPQASLIEVCRRFDLTRQTALFGRCIKCNGLLRAVDKDAVRDQLLPGTLRCYDQFHQCQSCGQVFWKGAHYERMKNLLALVLADGDSRLA